MAKSNNQINKENELRDNSPDSPAVIAYRLGQVESAVKEGFDAHNAKLDSVINNFSTKSEFNAHEVRIKSLEDWNSWATKLVLGAIILSVLALLGIRYSVIK